MTGSPVVEVASDEVTVVVVATAVTSVVMVRLQPPAMLPTSPLVSSTMNSLHSPLGLMPAKAPAKVVWLDGVGAGAGKLSTAAPGLLFVGGNVPLGTLTISGTPEAAESEKVRLMLLASLRLFGSPRSDSTTRLAPVGDTTIASTSLSAPWVRPLNVTVTLVTTPVIPLTGMIDGYGLAWPIWLGDPVAGMAIEVVLLNVVGPSAKALTGWPSTQPSASKNAVSTVRYRRARPPVANR